MEETIKRLTFSLVEAIRQNGSQSVFWGAIIEQLLGIFIPSPVIPMSAGFLLISQDLTFPSAVLQIIKRVSFPYALGVIIGASIFYFFGFFGGRAIIEKYGKFLGLSLKNIDKFRQRFTRGFKDEALIFFLLVLPVTSISLVAVACGFIGIPWLEFYLILFAGVFLRSIILASLGWEVGESYGLIVSGLEKTESLISIGIVGVSFLVLAFLYYKREKFFKSGE